MSRTPLPNYTRSTPGQTDLFMILSTFVIANTTKIDHDSGKSNQKLVTYSSFRDLPFKNRWDVVSQSRKPAELGGRQAIWERDESGQTARSLEERQLRNTLAYRPLPLDQKVNTSIKSFANLLRDNSKDQQWLQRRSLACKQKIIEKSLSKALSRQNIPPEYREIVNCQTRSRNTRKQDVTAVFARGFGKSVIFYRVSLFDICVPPQRVTSGKSVCVEH